MEDLTPGQAVVERELASAELMVRALEDIAKRLDHTDKAHITLDQQVRYRKLQERLFELTK